MKEPAFPINSLLSFKVEDKTLVDADRDTVLEYTFITTPSMIFRPEEEVIRMIDVSLATD
jgi:hypothetical protein